MIDNIKQDLMKQYEVRTNYEVLSGLEERIDSTLLSFKYKYKPLDDDDSTWILEIDESPYSLQEFLSELQQSQRSLSGTTVSARITEAFDKFTYAKLITIHNENLEKASPEFAAEIKSYYEGLLMFEVMQNEVWKKIQDDSLGQLNYYNANKSNFISTKKVSGIMASTTDKKIAKQLKNDMLADSLSVLKEKYKDVIFQELNQVEIDNGSLPKNLELSLNTPKTYNYNGQLLTIMLTEKTDEKLLEFEDVKGEVINKLQSLREEEWLDGLRKKYSIEINQNLLNSL